MLPILIRLTVPGPLQIRQKRARMIDKRDAGAVRQLPQQRRANSTHTESQTEKQTRNHTDLTFGKHKDEVTNALVNVTP